jgi:hypothetical protein
MTIANISINLQQIARMLNIRLLRLNGNKPVFFIFALENDGVAQYISNGERHDGVDLMRSLIARWEAGKADIPPHINPDLPKHCGVSQVLKYLRHERVGFVTWPASDDGPWHTHMAVFLGQPMSAGFASIEFGKVRCYGRSESLCLDSRPDDSAALAVQLGLSA